MMTDRYPSSSEKYEPPPPSYDTACQVWIDSQTVPPPFSSPSRGPSSIPAAMPRRSPASAAVLGIEDELSFGSDEDLLADVGEINVDTAVPPPLPHTQSGPMVSVSEVKVQKPRNSMLGGLKGLGTGKKEKEKDGRKRATTMETIRAVEAAPARSSLNLGSSSRESRKEKKEAKSLAGSALVIEPHLESVLDLSANASYYNVSSSKSSGSTPSLASASGHTSAAKKKPGLMGAFRGLRGRKEDPVRVFAGSNGLGDNRIHPVPSRDSVGSRISDISRQQSFDHSAFSTTHHTDDSYSSSAQHHTLAPISMSPFRAQPPDLTPEGTVRSMSSASKHTDGSSLARRTSLAGSTATGTSGGLPSSRGTFGQRWTPVDERSLERPSSIPSSLDRGTRPSLISSISTSSSSAAPASPLTPSLGAITSVLLPSFPATLASLESIQILSATVIKRMYTTPGLPDKEKSSSLRGLAGMLPSGNTSASAASPKKPLWITQQLVLTSFKVGGLTPHATPDLSDFSAPSRFSESRSRTIAHLHLFNVPGAAVSGHAKSPSRSSGSSAIGLGISSSQTFSSHHRGSVSEEMAEAERRVVTADSTAGVWDDGEGRRKFVMRILFGGINDRDDEDAEWVVEMRNAEQLHDWVRQIKSVAVIIRAEREGHGRVIRDAYKSGTLEADDLALELDMERRAASVRSPTSSGSRVTSRDLASEFSAPREEDIDVRPAGMERVPSAARAESPDMLGPADIPVEEDEAEKLAKQLRDFEISTAITRQRSFDDQSSLLGAFPLAPDAIDKAVRPASTAYPLLSQSPLIHEVGPTDSAQVPASSNTLSPSAAGALLSRKFGSLRSPPPPPSAPPTMPLPAIPTNQLQVTVEDGTSGPSLSPPVTTFTTSVDHDPPSPRLSNEPRLSLPSLEPPLAIPDRELALLQARQHYRAASLPTDDGSARQAAAKVRKERLARSFIPIPLAPEMTQSPVLSQSSGGNTPRSTGSPLIPYPAPDLQEEAEQEGSKTPAAMQLSRLPNDPMIDDGSSTPAFFTPTEEPSSISISSIDTPSTADFHPNIAMTGYRYTDELDRLRNKTHDNEDRPKNKRYSSTDAASILSVPSVSSRASTNASRRRRGIKPVAVDIMSEFSESAGANYQEEGEEAIKEDRPRVIRFAES